MALHHDRKKSEQRRLRAMELLDQGMMQVEVAREVGVSESAVAQWVKKRREGGDDALRAGKTTGPYKLNAAQLEKLELLLRDGPRKNGFDAKWWRSDDVAALVERNFGARYTGNHLHSLTMHLGWRADGRTRDHASISRYFRPPGCPWSLHESEVVELKTILTRSPRLQGFDADRWTNQLILGVIRKRYDADFPDHNLPRTLAYLKNVHGLKTASGPVAPEDAADTMRFGRKPYASKSEPSRKRAA